MQISFFTVFISVVSLVIMAMPGFLLAKLKMLPEKASEALSAVVLYGCQPLLVFMSFQSYEYSAEIGRNMLIVCGIAFAIHFIMIGLVCLLFRNKEDIKMKTVRYGSIFSNCGFMGIPFLSMLFSGKPEAGEILIYASVIIAVFNILNWTVGVLMMTGNVKDMSVKKILLNPVIIAVVVGVIVFVTTKKPLVNLAAEGTTLHSVLNKLSASLDYLGDAVTPLSMIVIGIKLADVNIKQLFLDKKAYVTSFFKLVVMSFVAIISVAFLPVSSSIKYTVFLLLSMPCATSTALFALLFGGDGDFATVCTLLSTILSIATLPLMFLLMNGAFGIAI